MNDQEILEKAIKKAIDNGWNWIWGSFLDIDSFKFTIDEDVSWGFYNNNESYWAEDPYGYISEIIFNHDFAKAIWGNPEYLYGENDEYFQFVSYNTCPQIVIPNWQYHLQGMVISDDPIKYLEENM